MYSRKVGGRVGERVGDCVCHRLVHADYSLPGPGTLTTIATSQNSCNVINRVLMCLLFSPNIQRDQFS